MAGGDWRSIPEMLFDQAAKRDGHAFLWGKQAGAWQSVSWAEAATTVRSLAQGLRALGVSAGDRIAIVMENRPEWVLADLAIMAAGAISVPAYTSFTTENYRHVLADSAARAVIIGSAALAERVLPAADQIAGLSVIVTLEPLGRQTRADVYHWLEVAALGSRKADGDAIGAVVRSLAPDDTACLIYTSGTGGVPKGVMLTHRNMMSNAEGARIVLESAFTLRDEVFLSFLPLTHSYEHTCGLVLPLALGAETYFTQPETLAADMAAVRPTIMTAVPRLCETLQKRIVQAAERTGGLSLRLFRAALRIGGTRYRAPATLTLADRLLDPLLTLLVRRKIRRRFGGRLKALVSGGAPLNAETGLFFVALGVTLLQGYGQTETGPVVGVNLPKRIKIDTVGPPLAGIEVRIAADGEVLIRGPNVMKGYWRDPETTARTIRDGWLHTGDVGALDAENYLTITDRKRDFIKNSGGEMISPQRIEGLLTSQPGIVQALVHGDRRPYLVALLVIEENRPMAAQAAVETVNRMLSAPERIRRHAVLDEPFTVANGMMTPTLKNKRHVIRETYAALIEGLYGT